MVTAEAVRELIAKGETASTEFKSSLRWDLREQKTNKALEQVVAKTIAGFANSDGGTLLIGVSDEGQVLGIEHDIQTLSRKSLDGFQLALRTTIGTLLGVDVSAEISLEFCEIDGKKVAVVVCGPHTGEPVFVKEGERYTLYVRDGNSTRPLNGEEQHR